MFPFLLLCGAALAAPAPMPAAHAELQGRQVLSGLLGDVLGGVDSALSSGDVNGILSALSSATPTSTPTSPSQAASQLQDIVQTAKPSNIFEYNAMLATNGLISGTVESLITEVGGQFTAENSESNSNPDPPTSVYPQKKSCDATYATSESEIRSAIYIPSTFTHGQKPPVILFPGTGNHGYETFAGNFIKLLSGCSWADPVWVNVPGRLLGDAQINAEYAAYAINYIASLTSSNVTMLAWSQGNIDTQWAFKYFPSTRDVVTDHVAISPDYAGTIFADFICPADLTFCSPSVYQQEYLTSSNFITALRQNDGDSAYVPTTTIYSGLFDEIVEPQQGTGASAYLLDARNVGVSNNEVQTVCAGKGLAATFYTHEGVLYNPLALALLQDAMANDGPGSPDRVDLDSVCAGYLADGLELGDLLVTENAILIAGLGVLVTPPRATAEPALAAYASGVGGTCAS